MKLLDIQGWLEKAIKDLNFMKLHNADGHKLHDQKRLVSMYDKLRKFYK